MSSPSKSEMRDQNSHHLSQEIPAITDEKVLFDKCKAS